MTAFLYIKGFLMTQDIYEVLKAFCWKLDVTKVYRLANVIARKTLWIIEFMFTVDQSFHSVNISQRGPGQVGGVVRWNSCTGPWAEMFLLIRFYIQYMHVLGIKEPHKYNLYQILHFFENALFSSTLRLHDQEDEISRLCKGVPAIPTHQPECSFTNVLIFWQVIAVYTRCFKTIIQYLSNYNYPDHFHRQHGLILKYNFSNAGFLKCDKHLIFKVLPRQPLAEKNYYSLFRFGIYWSSRSSRRFCVNILNSSICPKRFFLILAIASLLGGSIFKHSLLNRLCISATFLNFQQHFRINFLRSKFSLVSAIISS